MNKIKIYEDIKPKNPVMIAAWPEPGNVALLAVDYIRNHLKAKKFAMIKNEMNPIGDSVVVNNGIAKLQENSMNSLYYAEDPELIIFEGMVPKDSKDRNNMISDLLDIAQQYQVSHIYTGGSIAEDMNYSEESLIYAAANQETLRNSLLKKNLHLLSKGNITGMNASLIGHAEKRSIKAACLFATMPIYITGFGNPKASKALVKIFEDILETSIDYAELDKYIKKSEKLMNFFEKNILGKLPQKLSTELIFEEADESEEDEFDYEEEPLESPAILNDNTIPEHISEKIEKLFTAAENSSDNTDILKKELNRWNMFEKYQDRFLDLFKKDI